MQAACTIAEDANNEPAVRSLDQSNQTIVDAPSDRDARLISKIAALSETRFEPPRVTG